MADPKIVCFGEVLWDVLPSGKVAGGAPMNVAFHFKNFGMEALLASRIGQDKLGGELYHFLEQKGLNLELLQEDNQHPTSTVQVSLDAEGHASYEIVQPVAWDFIEWNDKMASAVQRAEALVYGSLASRNNTSRNTLKKLLEAATKKVFDVNLRTPHFSKEVIEELMNKADLVKMNDDELAMLSNWFGSGSSNERDKMQRLLNTFELSGLILTKGKDGAAYLDKNKYYTSAAYPVKIEDTVGSGDSFLAGFLTKLLQGKPPEECLNFACATGALVATQKGGTPSIKELQILEMMNDH